MDSRALARFRAKYVEQDTGYRTPCWIFLGGIVGVGYGTLMVDGRKQYAHRVAYEHWRGAIASGLVIDHLCRVRHCVNPDHLAAITQRENILRGTSAQKRREQCALIDRCPAGHAYDERNTYHYDGERHCRACNRDRARVRIGYPKPKPDHFRCGHPRVEGNYHRDGQYVRCRECRTRQRRTRYWQRRDELNAKRRVATAAKWSAAQRTQAEIASSHRPPL